MSPRPVVASVLMLVLGLAVWGQPGPADEALVEARAAVARQDYAAAVGPLERVVVLRPDDVEAWLLLARSQYQLGQIEPAIVAFERVRRLSPQEPYARSMLEALSGRQATAEGELALIRRLRADGAYAAAYTRADRLAQRGGLSEALRADARAEALEAALAAGDSKLDVRVALAELLALVPTERRTARETLLEVRVGLLTGQLRGAAARAALEAIVADANPPAPMAA